MAKTKVIIPTEGWNRVDPSHLLSEGQCSVLTNIIPRNSKLSKIGGTNRYNTTALTSPITWAERYYGKLADGSFTKKTFCFSGNDIYVGDDVAKTLTSVKGGFTSGVIPETATAQVSGNSVMFFFTGKDTPHYYDGNGSNTWYASAITYKLAQGVIWLDRLWSFEPNSSILRYSKNLDFENFTDSTDAGEIIIGSDKDSFIRRLVFLGDTLFIFKNNSIYYIGGNSPASFSVNLVSDKYGLAGQRAICKAGTLLNFVNELDKEIYSFGGTESSIQLLSDEIKFGEILDQTKTDDICCAEHDNLFRLSFNHMEATPQSLYNSHEVCYPITERNQSGKVKWFLTQGANINCYSIWNRQGDKNELVTGRSDIGCLMYHNRGRNWDTTAMTIKLRTKDDIMLAGRNCRFNYFQIDASPQQDKTVTLRWYLNSRNYGATASSVTQALDGEEKALAGIYFTTQARFLDRVVPVVDYAKGNSISFEIEDSTLNLYFDLYMILIDYEIGDIVRNNLIGG